MLASTGPLLDLVGVRRALMHWGLGEEGHESGEQQQQQQQQ